ncbi:MAG: hypothetical protein AAF351_05370 [Pseudomonadota bacterium]
MEPITIVLIVVLVTALGYLIWMRKKAREEAEAPKPRSQSRATAFHAVSIKYSSSACESAKAMSGRRFLATAAPRLPLAECDVLECDCRFTHHEDRRTGKDRRSPFRSGGLGGGTGAFENEQRVKGDRRQYDD